MTFSHLPTPLSLSSLSGEDDGDTRSPWTPPTSPSLASPASPLTLSTGLRVRPQSRQAPVDDDDLEMMVYQTEEIFEDMSLEPRSRILSEMTSLSGVHIDCCQSQSCQWCKDTEEPKTPTNQGIPFTVPGAPRATPPLSIIPKENRQSSDSYSLYHHASFNSGMAFMAIN